MKNAFGHSGTWAFRQLPGYRGVLSVSFSDPVAPPVSIELTFEQHGEYMIAGWSALENLAGRVGSKPWKFQDQQFELSPQVAAEVVPEWSGTWKA